MSKLKRLLAVLVCVAMAMALLPCMTVGAEDVWEKADDPFVYGVYDIVNEDQLIEPKQPAHGIGSPADPYQISTAAELYWFAQQVNGGKNTSNAVLTADIVVNENLLRADGTPRHSGAQYILWKPIGSVSNYPFKGTFDGKGHTISGLYYSDERGSEVGLFGFINSGSIVKNVGIMDSYFYGSHMVGGICGYNEESTIDCCYFKGTVKISGMTDYGAIGGICGWLRNRTALVSNCINYGMVDATNGHSCAGGITGYTEFYCVVNGCANFGQIYCSNGTYGGISGFGGYNNFKNSVSLDTVCTNLIDDQWGGIVVENVKKKNGVEFARGEVAFLLNGEWSGGETWRQNIGVDDYPFLAVFDESKGKVYCGYEHGGSVLKYANTPLHEEADGEGVYDHDAMYKNGVCTVCGKRQDGGSTGVAATGVTLSPTSMSLKVGESRKITATVLPANATNKAVSWTTSSGAATVSNDGTVTAKSAGTAIITAATADGGHTAQCNVTVTDGETPTPPPTEYTADIVVGTVIGQAGKEVTVPVRIANNPGIAALNIQINYDRTKLTPVTIELGSALGVGTVTSNIQQGGEMSRFDFVTAYWDNPANVTGNGDLVNVTFKVAEGLEDQLIPVTVSYNSGEIINQNYETVDFNLIGGGVKLNGVKMGDIYSDGKVDSKDGLKLRQYLAKWDVELSDTERAAADVFHDGDITSKDGLKLRQYLAKWDVSLEEAALMAAGDGRIKFEVGTVSADGDGYADVPVSITENTGVAVFNVQLDFDKSLLTPVSIEGNGVYGGITSNIQQSVDPGSFDFVTAYWDNPSNVTDTGTAFTVRFKVAEGFSGSAPVKLTYYENDLPCDQSFNELAVEAVDGAVNAGGSAGLYTVNSLDVEKAGASLRVKADVTKNGERSGEDAIVIAMYKDGALVDMLFMEAEFAQGQTARFGGMMTAVEGATVKAFVWDDLTTMTALSNTVEK